MLQALHQVGVDRWPRCPVLIRCLGKQGQRPLHEVVPLGAGWPVPGGANRVVVRLVDRLGHAGAQHLAHGQQFVVLVAGVRDERCAAEAAQQLVAVTAGDHDVELVGEAGVQDGVGLQAIGAGADARDDGAESPRVLQVLGPAVADLLLGRACELEEKADVGVAVRLAGPVTGDPAVEDLPQVGRHRDAVREQVEQRLDVGLLGHDARVALAEVLDVSDLDAQLPNLGRMGLELRAQLLEERALADQFGAKRGLQRREVLIAPHLAGGEQGAVADQALAAPAIEEVVDLGAAPVGSRHGATLPRGR